MGSPLLPPSPDLLSGDAHILASEGEPKEPGPFCCRRVRYRDVPLTSSSSSLSCVVFRLVVGIIVFAFHPVSSEGGGVGDISRASRRTSGENELQKSRPHPSGKGRGRCSGVGISE